MINNIFDNVYCLNLERRQDRWKECTLHFTKHNIKVEKFTATDGKVLYPKGGNNLLPGELGIIDSYIQLITDAKEKNYEQILIFEDDVELDSEFSSKFPEYYNLLPKDWVILYMGGTHFLEHVTDINHRIAQTRKTYSTHAVGIKKIIFDPFLESLKEKKSQVDLILSKFQQNHPSYVCVPHIAWQKEGFSDILEKEVHYEYMKPKHLRKK